MKNLVVLFLLLFVVTSCTMQKRRYNRGFHVEWFDSGAAQNDKSSTNKSYSPTKKKEEHKTPEIEIKKNPRNKSINYNDSSGLITKPHTQNVEERSLEIEKSNIFGEIKNNRIEEETVENKESLTTVKENSDKPKTWGKNTQC